METCTCEKRSVVRRSNFGWNLISYKYVNTRSSTLNTIFTSNHMVLLKFEVCTMCWPRVKIRSYSAFTSDRMVLLKFKSLYRMSTLRALLASQLETRSVQNSYQQRRSNSEGTPKDVSCFQGEHSTFNNDWVAHPCFHYIIAIYIWIQLCNQHLK